MSEEMSIAAEKVDALYERLDREAEASGYHLNPDVEFTRGLVEGLLINEERYGYWACPCHLAEGDKQKDLDIICPCDYRDADLLDRGACYCALYVSDDVLRGERELQSVPERRPTDESQRPQNRPARAPTRPGGEDEGRTARLALPGVRLPALSRETTWRLPHLQGQAGSLRALLVAPSNLWR